jgi:hypothetical protein
VGWVRYKTLDPAFFPFLILLSAATVNEIISATAINLCHQSNAVNCNIYSLAESMIIIWQFARWKLFYRKETLLYGVCIFLIALWIDDNLFHSHIYKFNSHFSITYGFVVVMMSITMADRLLRPAQFHLSTRSILLICFCFSIFYTYSSLVEVFWVLGLRSGKTFRLNIYRILYYVNLFTNLTYILAILWAPRKREFLRLF